MKSLLAYFVFVDIATSRQNLVTLEKFLSDAASGGAFISPLISIGKVSNMAGIGVVAKSDISNGTIVVEVPWTQVFTVKVAKTLLHRFRGMSLTKVSDHDLVALALMQLVSLEHDDYEGSGVCENLDDDDDWERCSRRDDFNLTVLTSYANMLWQSNIRSAFNRMDLFPPVLFPDVEYIQEQIVAEWKKLRSLANVADDSHMSLADYRLALALVQSRVHRVALPNGTLERSSADIDSESSVHALVPLADYFNAADPGLINVKCDSALESFTCIATRKVQKGKELLVQYGSSKQHDNLHFMTNYGFSLASLAGKHTIAPKSDLDELLIHWERYSTSLVPQWEASQTFYCLEKHRLEIDIHRLRAPGLVRRNHSRRNYSILPTFSSAPEAANSGVPSLVKSNSSLKEAGECNAALSALNDLHLHTVQTNSAPYFVPPRPTSHIPTYPPPNTEMNIFSHMSLPLVQHSRRSKCKMASDLSNLGTVFIQMRNESEQFCHTSVNQPVVEEELGALLPFLEHFGLLDDPEARYHPTAFVLAATSQTQSALRYDRSHNVYAQLCGSKRFVMYPPEAVRMLRLYPWVSDRNQQALDSFDGCSRENISEYRLTFETARFDIILEQGQSLYVPPYWFRAFAVEDGPALTLSVLSPSQLEIYSSYASAYLRHALNLTRGVGEATDAQRLGICLYVLRKLKIEPAIVNQRALEAVPVEFRATEGLCWVPEDPSAEVRKLLREVLKKIKDSLAKLSTGVRHITEGNLAEEAFHFAFGVRMPLMLRWCGVDFDFT